MYPDGLVDCVLRGWRPGIGDPEATGWLTVLAYLLCAGLAVAVWRRQPRGPGRTFWAVIAGLMLFLGLNKQLDLQTALTQAGRCLAHAQGWYDQRRVVQAAFILGLLAASVMALLLARRMLRGSLRGNRLALIGLTVLTAFVMVRAVGFHHVDALIGRREFGVSTNYLFENAGLLLIALNAAALLRRARGRAASRA